MEDKKENYSKHIHSEFFEYKYLFGHNSRKFTDSSVLYLQVPTEEYSPVGPMGPMGPVGCMGPVGPMGPMCPTGAVGHVGYEPPRGRAAIVNTPESWNVNPLYCGLTVVVTMKEEEINKLIKYLESNGVVNGENEYGKLHYGNYKPNYKIYKARDKYETRQEFVKGKYYDKICKLMKEEYDHDNEYVKTLYKNYKLKDYILDNESRYELVKHPYFDDVLEIMRDYDSDIEEEDLLNLTEEHGVKLFASYQVVKEKVKGKVFYKLMIILYGEYEEEEVIKMINNNNIDDIFGYYKDVRYNDKREDCKELRINIYYGDDWEKYVEFRKLLSDC